MYRSDCRVFCTIHREKTGGSFREVHFGDQFGSRHLSYRPEWSCFPQTVKDLEIAKGGKLGDKQEE